MKNPNFITSFIILPVLLILGVGCVDESKKTWELTIYPAGLGAPNMKFKLSNYETLEQCQDAAKTKLKAMRIESRGEYQCRNNCKINESGNKKCEETVS